MGAEAQRLGADLHVAVQRDVAELAHADVGGLSVRPAYAQAPAGATDARALLGDVQGASSRRGRVQGPLRGGAEADPGLVG